MRSYSAINPQFVQLLAARGLTPAKIIEQADIGYAHGLQVFSGKRPGGRTRRKLAGYLVAEELAALGWTGPSTLRDHLFEREDAALATARRALDVYQANRLAMQRIALLVQERPEIFGAVPAGENGLAAAADWLEKQFLNKHEAEPQWAAA